jgi:hypothetical protein
MLELVRKNSDDPQASKLEEFLVEVLNVYDKHGFDLHISWDK